MSHQQSFSYKGTGLPGLNQYLARIYVLAQGHNTVTPVRLEPTALSHESSTIALSHCAPFLMYLNFYAGLQIFCKIGGPN